MKPLGGIRSVIRSYTSWTAAELNAVLVAGVPFLQIKVPENFIVDKITGSSDALVGSGLYPTANVGYTNVAGDSFTYFASGSTTLLNGVWSNMNLVTAGSIKPIKADSATYITIASVQTITTASNDAYNLSVQLFGYSFK